MHKQILKYLPQNLPMKTRASAPEMTLKAETQTTSCQRRAPWLAIRLSDLFEHHAAALFQHWLLVDIGWRDPFPPQ